MSHRYVGPMTSYLTNGKHRYMIVDHGNGDLVILVRRIDLRSSKWSTGNVTPDGEAWVRANYAREGK